VKDVIKRKIIRFIISNSKLRGFDETPTCQVGVLMTKCHKNSWLYLNSPT
jgi:hypothetical protein